MTPEEANPAKLRIAAAITSIFLIGLVPSMLPISICLYAFKVPIYQLVLYVYINVIFINIYRGAYKYYVCSINGHICLPDALPGR